VFGRKHETKQGGLNNAPHIHAVRSFFLEYVSHPPPNNNDNVAFCVAANIVESLVTKGRSGWADKEENT